MELIDVNFRTVKYVFAGNFHAITFATINSNSRNSDCSFISASSEEVRDSRCSIIRHVPNDSTLVQYSHSQLVLDIKVLFVPPNTTSRLQPLNLGIIQNFKVHYRILFLQFVLSQIDTCTKASDVAKSLNILHAIRWVAKAQDAVSPETIKKGF